MHSVLWTGGWDSTFRVLQLAESGEDVQPIYLVDPKRPSITQEVWWARDRSDAPEKACPTRTRVARPPD